MYSLKCFTTFKTISGNDCTSYVMHLNYFEDLLRKTKYYKNIFNKVHATFHPLMNLN